MSRQPNPWIRKGVDQLHKLGLLSINPVDQISQPSCLIRVVSAMNFLVVIVCLALWITTFILFQESSLQRQLSTNLSSNLTCVTFFGGLAIAIVIGTLLGNFLRRSLWNLLIKTRKH